MTHSHTDTGSICITYLSMALPPLHPFWLLAIYLEMESARGRTVFSRLYRCKSVCEAAKCLHIAFIEYMWKRMRVHRGGGGGSFLMLPVFLSFLSFPFTCVPICSHITEANWGQYTLSLSGPGLTKQKRSNSEIKKMVDRDWEIKERRKKWVGKGGKGSMRAGKRRRKRSCRWTGGRKEAEKERKKWQPQIKFPSCQCTTEFDSVYWQPLAWGKLHSEAEHGMNAHISLSTHASAHTYTYMGMHIYCTQCCMSSDHGEKKPSGWCEHADKQYIPWGPCVICVVHVYLFVHVLFTCLYEWMCLFGWNFFTCTILPVQKSCTF